MKNIRKNQTMLILILMFKLLISQFQTQKMSIIKQIITNPLMIKFHRLKRKRSNQKIDTRLAKIQKNLHH